MSLCTSYTQTVISYLIKSTSLVQKASKKASNVLTLTMSEVLRSPSEITNYESSFTHPTSEEAFAMTSTTNLANQGSFKDFDMLNQEESPVSPRMPYTLPYSNLKLSVSPTMLVGFSQPGYQNLNGIVTQDETSIPPLIPTVAEAAASKAASYTEALKEKSGADLNVIVDILCHTEPENVTEYAELINKLSALMHEGQITEDQQSSIEKKFNDLTEYLPRYTTTEDPIASQLHVIVQRCFYVLTQLSMDNSKADLSAKAISFLTSVMINLNYWEVFNLLQLMPSIRSFLNLIKFDLNECYTKFMANYAKYRYQQVEYPPSTAESFSMLRERRKQDLDRRFSAAFNDDLSLDYDDHDKFVSDQLAGEGKGKDRRKVKVDDKLAAHRIIKKPELKAGARSANYDPDVIHECQLPSAEEPGKLCLRRFSRKYELIRHQDTVHLKKKKLFKCFVCVKQDPVMGPRIFTRHDTLAKHIRVNHHISGKEAKAEVAYSKKHAEIVDEGDITVHVGRRKTKVDFELRAHMNKRGAREAPDGSIIFDDEDYSGEEGEPMIDVV